VIPGTRLLTLAAVTALALAGCELDAGGRGADPGGADGLASIGPTTRARFVRAVDGDTIHVEIDGEQLTVRLIGLDAPELARGGEPAEPLATDATEAAVDLLDDAPSLVLERDRSDTDRFGRLLRYVWQPVGGDWRLLNAELARLGLAEARDYRPDTGRQAILDAAEDEARRARRGIWGAP
jgi:micrococcal nuclease